LPIFPLVGAKPWPIFANTKGKYSMNRLKIVTHSTYEDVVAIRDDWDRLSTGLPFSSWEWALASWRYLESDSQLHVLSLRDEQGTIVAIVPWSVSRAAFLGKTLRFLGSGKSCSDYLQPLFAPEFADQVRDSICEYLLHHQQGTCPATEDVWSFLDFDGVKREDALMGQIVEQLRGRGITIHVEPQVNSWRCKLPKSWDQFLTNCTGSRRRFIRKVLKIQESNHVELSEANEANKGEFFQIFRNLHQTRRESLGERGCFSFSGFPDFLSSMTDTWLKSHKLVFRILKIDGVPAAASWNVVDNGTFYVYQTGMNSAMRSLTPGWLMVLLNMKFAVESGLTYFDFLRGDESYKQRLAEPIPLCRIRGVANQFYCEAIDAVRRRASLVKRRFFSPLVSTLPLSVTPGEGSN
jgi:CelD/BcsL family acetyltransferase involved in cellulose biosynthesis